MQKTPFMPRPEIAKFSLLFAALCAAAGTVSAGEAKNVFKKVAPSVVLIRDLEGHGSGVVISPDGLILTNYHVVNTPLSLSVTAEVDAGGRRASRTFQDVSVLGVHPQYDAALIRVRAPGVRFFPATGREGAQPETGDACYAIGNPSGAEGQALTNSISPGIVGAAARQVEGLSYIQFTAPINPGNSGGALCDAEGRVIGLVTFKIEQTEGIGFAIPIGLLRRDAFGPVSKRKPDYKKAREYENLGKKYYTYARRARGEEREAALVLAYICFRLCLNEVPNDAAPYHNVGLMYYDLKEPEVAEAFLQKSVELDPNGPASYQTLGMIAIVRGDEDAALARWARGMQCRLDDQTDRASAAMCADNFSINMIQHKKYAQAAYCARWALLLGVTPKRKRVLEDLLQEAKGELPAKLYEYIINKRDDFSFSDPKVALPKVADAPVQKPSRPPDHPASPTQAQGEPDSAAEDALLIAASAPSAPDHASLPGEVVDATLAHGGAYLVLQCRGEKCLRVFNIAHGKFEKDIPAPSDAIFAAGGSCLLVYSQTQKQFEKWSMKTFQRTAAHPSRTTKVLTNVAMGLDNPNEALISYAESTDALATRHYNTLDLRTFNTRNIAANFRNGSYRNRLHIRTDARLQSVAIWCTSHTPTGLVYAYRAVGTWNTEYKHSSFGILGLSPSGQRIYTGRGQILDSRLQVVKEVKGSLFPVYGSKHYLHLDPEGQVRVCGEAAHEAVHQFAAPMKFERGGWEKNAFTRDRQVWASAAANRVAFIDNKTRRIHLCALGLPPRAPRPSKPQPGPRKPERAAKPEPGPAAGPSAKEEEIARSCQGWLSLARSYKAAGKKEKAREYLQKIIDTYPDTPHAKQARRELGRL